MVLGYTIISFSKPSVNRLCSNFKPLWKEEYQQHVCFSVHKIAFSFTSSNQQHNVGLRTDQMVFCV